MRPSPSHDRDRRRRDYGQNEDARVVPRVVDPQVHAGDPPGPRCPYRRHADLDIRRAGQRPHGERTNRRPERTCLHRGALNAEPRESTLVGGLQERDAGGQGSPVPVSSQRKCPSGSTSRTFSSSARPTSSMSTGSGVNACRRSFGFAGGFTMERMARSGASGHRGAGRGSRGEAVGMSGTRAGAVPRRETRGIREFGGSRRWRGRFWSWRAPLHLRRMQPRFPE